MIRDRLEEDAMYIPKILLKYLRNELAKIPAANRR